ncbi:DMT family transporter [Candidatus Falkowbacteria bacterium]|nr:DMT family transporter [Candidatus Falkowbacteria bacterium]
MGSLGFNWLGTGASVSFPSLHLLLWSLITSISYLGGTWFYFKAMKIGEASRVAPALSLNQIWAVLLATVFLGEIFSWVIYIGVAFIFLGCFFISYSKDFWRLKGQVLPLMIAGTILYSSGGIISKYLVGFYDYWPVFAYGRLFSGVILFVYFIWRFRTMRQESWRVYTFSALSETLTVIAGVLYIAALVTGPAALVSAVNASHYVWIFIWSILLSLWLPQILKEELRRGSLVMKSLAISFIIVGVVIISLYTVDYETVDYETPLIN